MTLKDATEGKEYKEVCLDRLQKAAALRYEEILEVINNEVERTSVVYFAKQKIKARHIAYQGNKEATGGARLDIDKVRNMMLFFASKCQNLYKVKLMKLLWFADALFCQRYNTSMSGLVYQHMPMGALPIVHNDLMELVPVETIVDDYSQLESYRVLPCPDVIQPQPRL